MNIIKPAIILTIIGFICSFALSHINRLTMPYILKQDIEKQNKALSSVLPGFFININDKAETKIDGEDFSYWTGEKKDITGDKTTRGYAFICEKAGYSGPVRSMVGVDENWTILGISILQQSETPGLGARSIEIASSMTFLEFISGKKPAGFNKEMLPWFQEQFRGLESGKPITILKKGDWNPSIRDELLYQNAISAITGATITTKAVRDSIESGIGKLRRILEQEQAAKEPAQ